MMMSTNGNTSTKMDNDQIKFLVGAGNDEGADSDEQRDIRADLVIQLRAITEAQTPASAAPAPAATTGAAAGDGPTLWTITARFGPEIFRNGMDPLSIARYLGGLGRVLSMQCSTDNVPSLVGLNPETCYLSFVMVLESKATREEIDGAFSFVREDCEIEIVAPETAQQKLAREIEELPETPRLGDMLVSVGAVTQDQLSQILTTQEKSRGAPVASQAKLGNLLETQAGVPHEVVEAALGLLAR